MAARAVAWAPALAVKPATGAPVVRLIEAILRLVTPLTVLKEPATYSLVPSGEASTALTPPPPKVGRNDGVDQPGLVVVGGQVPLVDHGGVAGGVLQRGERARDEDALAHHLDVPDLAGADPGGVGPGRARHQAGVAGSGLRRVRRSAPRPGPAARVARTIAIAAMTARDRVLRRVALGTWSPGVNSRDCWQVQRMLRSTLAHARPCTRRSRGQASAGNGLALPAYLLLMPMVAGSTGFGPFAPPRLGGPMIARVRPTPTARPAGPGRDPGHAGDRRRWPPSPTPSACPTAGSPRGSPAAAAPPCTSGRSRPGPSGRATPAPARATCWSRPDGRAQRHRHQGRQAQPPVRGRRAPPARRSSTTPGPARTWPATSSPPPGPRPSSTTWP